MSINVWIAQTAEAKADVEEIKVAPDVAEEVIVVVDEAPSIRLDENGDVIVEEAAPIEEAVKEEKPKVKKPLKGTQKERKEYARVVSKIADKTDGMFVDVESKGAMTRIESVYVDSLEEIAVLEKGGADIVGAWDSNSGEPIPEYHPSPRIGDYLPPVRTYDKDGNIESERPGELADMVVFWGQAPRKMA